MRRHYDALVQHRGERRGHRFVVGGAALKIDLFTDPTVAHHSVEIVLHHAERQACGDVFFGYTLLQISGHVLFHEHGAAFAHLHRSL